MTVQHARDDLDVVLLGERLAELGQQVRGRLDAGPVVLVEDEDPRAIGGLAHALRLAPRMVGSRPDRGEEAVHARPVAPVLHELP